MARRPLLTAFARLIGEMLTGEGFQTAPDGLRWWLRSDLGDFAVIDVQAARGLARRTVSSTWPPYRVRATTSCAG